MNDFPITGFSHYDGTSELPFLNPQPTTLNRHNVPRFCNRHVSRLLLDTVPIACDVERRDPQAPPWEAVSVRVPLLCGHGNHSTKAPDFLF